MLSLHNKLPNPNAQEPCPLIRPLAILCYGFCWAAPAVVEDAGSPRSSARKKTNDVAGKAGAN